MIKMATEKELRSKKATRKAPKTVPTNDSNVPTNESNATECVINDDVSKDKDLVRCFCGNDQDFGEMACCDLCCGWFHFRCMRFKENVDLLTQKDFVCCFCLASKTLSLLRDVERLKQELKEIRVNMAAAGKQTAINHGEDKLTTEDDDRKNPSYSDAVKVSPKCKEPNKKNEAKRGSSQKKLKRDSRKKQRAEVSGKSVSSSPARSKEFVGRRKLWGTKKVDTEEEIKATLVSKVPNAHGVEVKRVFKNENGRYRWWFWIYGGESVLKLLDEVSFGVYWKIEKKSPFLDSVVVRVLGR